MTLPKIIREEEEAKKKFRWREVWGIREAENMGMVDVDIEDAEWFGLLDRYKGGYYKKGLYTRKQWNKIIESAMIEIGGTDELTKKDLMNYMNFKEAEYNEANKKAELLKERDRKIELYKQQVIELEQDNKDYEKKMQEMKKEAGDPSTDAIIKEIILTQTEKEKNETIKNMNRTIEAKESIIRSMNKTISLQDVTIKLRDEGIKLRDEKIRLCEEDVLELEKEKKTP